MLEKSHFQLPDWGSTAKKDQGAAGCAREFYEDMAGKATDTDGNRCFLHDRPDGYKTDNTKAWVR